VLLIINVAVAAGEGQRWPNELGKPRTPKATNQSYPHLHRIPHNGIRTAMRTPIVFIPTKWGTV